MRMIEKNRYTIRGSVYDRETGDPIIGASIKATYADRVFTASTDPSGDYLIIFPEEVKRARVRIEAGFIDYVSLATETEVKDGDTTPLNLDLIKVGSRVPTRYYTEAENQADKKPRF